MTPELTEILTIFKQINQIPRCSKNEYQIAKWLKTWAIQQGFKIISDDLDNLVIKVPASPGYETAPIVILQGHMDMVCEKTLDSDHDFTKDPIRFVYEGDWLKADRTTLGADNGIAMALAMAIATSAGKKENKNGHPPLELLFTVDEETGLTGAVNLKPDFLEGRILINIDSEDEGVFTVGCAGGNETRISLPLIFSPLDANQELFQIKACGMQGGHSGIDIKRQRANANQILARCLAEIGLITDFRLLELNGGTTHNAIPRDANALIACGAGQKSKLKKAIKDLHNIIINEFKETEPSLSLEIRQLTSDNNRLQAASGQAASGIDSKKAVQLLRALPHGVATRLAENVETSNNLATVEIKKEHLEILSSQRSFCMSRLADISERIKAIGNLSGASVNQGNHYPAWEPDLNSQLLKQCQKVYKTLFKKDPRVETIHAGLECGVIGAKYPGMEMISIGPTIRNPHSPDESLFIPSVGKVMEFLKALLASYLP